VAFGTSLPELATSIAAVLNDETGIVISTVVGSNITNIALILGLVAVVVKRIDLEYNIWHIDIPFLLGSAFILWFVLFDRRFLLLEALIFLLGIVVFLGYSVKFSKDEPLMEVRLTWRTYLMLLIGGILIWLSSHYTIFAIRKLSIIGGINPELVALSAVALGTSLPEVIVSLSAARRGKTSIAVGNVLGSNVFNTYVVVAIPSFFGRLSVPPGIMEYYLPLMIVMSLLFGVMANNKKITRWEGIVLLMFYMVFLSEVFKEFA
jgi:cation:H+ antiporter